ncbi:MAG: hypothetical protein ACI8W7_001288 [Gammaproteobacteria bacterium]
MLTVALLLCCVIVQAQSTGAKRGLELRMTNSLLVVPAAGTGVAARETAVQATTGDTARPIAWGFRGLSLRLTSGLRFDDNPFSSDRNEQREVIAVTKPAVYLDAKLGRHDLRLGYEADIERFLALSSENHLNQKISAIGNVDISRRMKSILKSALETGTDSRGEIGTRLGASGVADRWRQHDAGVEMTLGRRIAKAQIGVQFNVTGQRYLNNNQQSRDYDQRNLRLSGRYNLGSKYSIIADLSGAWTDYLDAVSTLDSREYAALVGVQWEATAKTSGKVSFGLRHRDLHDPNQQSNGGFTWDASVKWAPKTYSQFTAYSSRTVSEGGFIGTGANSVTISDTSGLIWRHGLSERTTLEARVERSLSGAGDGDEDDERMSYGTGLRYRLNRWVDVFGNWEFRSNSSPTAGSDFEATQFFIGFDTHLDHSFKR